MFSLLTALSFPSSLIYILFSVVFFFLIALQFAQMLCKTSFAPDTTHNNNDNDVEILLHLFLFCCLVFARLLSVFLVNFDKITCRLYDAQRVFDSDTQAAPL